MWAAVNNASSVITTFFKRFSKGFYLLFFLLMLGGAAYIRFWAAPLSAGVDVPQFRAFAQVFHLYGLDFYRYADANLSIFPVQGWGFVYPPVWLLILGFVLLFAPPGAATETMVTTGWRLAEKAPIIIADLAIGCLIYWAVPGARWKKLLFAVLWLFHPTVWYNSAVFGQFDAIAAAFLLAAVILLERGRDRAAFIIAGLAVMTKQHVVIPVLFMMAVSLRALGWRRVLADCGIMAGVMVALSIPFLVTGNFLEYGSSLFLPGQSPGYQSPLMYAFSGAGSLLTYLHDVLGWETGGYIWICIPVLITAVIACLVISLKRPVTVSQGALIGFLLFIGLNYRVNYQYLVIYIPLALWVAAQSRYWGERVYVTIMALLPAAWVWIFNAGFWFYHTAPAHYEALPVLERIGLTRMGTPDHYYVILAVTLMCVWLVYIVLAFTIWRRRPQYPRLEIRREWRLR